MAHGAKAIVSFNKDYMKRVKKDVFTSNHKHLADLGVDLEAEWLKYNPKKESEEKK